MELTGPAGEQILEMHRTRLRAKLREDREAAIACMSDGEKRAAIQTENERRARPRLMLNEMLRGIGSTSDEIPDPRVLIEEPGYVVLALPLLSTEVDPNDAYNAGLVPTEMKLRVVFRCERDLSWRTSPEDIVNIDLFLAVKSAEVETSQRLGRILNYFTEAAFLREIDLFDAGQIYGLYAPDFDAPGRPRIPLSGPNMEFTLKAIKEAHKIATADITGPNSQNSLSFVS